MNLKNADHMDLSWLEQQIEKHKRQLDRGCTWLKFPQWLEGEYAEHRNQQFLATAKVTLLMGILFYLVLGAYDFRLGLEHGPMIFSIRILIVSGLLIGLFISLNTHLKEKMIELAGIGIFIVSSSVLLFIHLIDEPYSYIYHFGLIPLQVYVLVVYRQSFRATLFVSAALLFSFILFSEVNDFQPSTKVIDDLVVFIRPLFVVFWLIMILMGSFLTYYLEYSSRLDFIKSRLLELDGQRLQTLSEKLHVLSTTDSLTSLANRRHFEFTMDEEWRRAKRSSEELAVVMIDVDHFKQFNDRFGHLAGDECLVKVSQVLINNTQRAGELAGRYGGEEFILLLPKTDEDQAGAIAERIRKQIESLKIKNAHPRSEYLTASFGIAVVVPNDRISQDQLVSMADTCLYKAKESGRNKVCRPADYY